MIDETPSTPRRTGAAPSDRPGGTSTPRRYTIEELSAATGMPTRRIRYYQSEGVLPPPTRTGRSAYYGDEHLARLRVVAELHRRGLRLGAIAGILYAQENLTPAMPRLMSTEATLDWIDDLPLSLTADEVAARLERFDDETRRDLHRLGFFQPQPDGTYLVRSPAILDITLRLIDVGVSPETSSVAGLLIQPKMAELAKELVAWFLSRLGAGFTEHGSPEEFDAALAVLKPAAAEAAGIFLAHALEDELARWRRMAEST